MIWVPIVLGVFKVTVLGTTIFLSLKSHRDGERQQQKERDTRRQQAALRGQKS